MPPLTNSYAGADLALSTTPVDGATITLTGSLTADTYWFVFGTLAYKRLAGSAYIRVDALFKYTGLPQGISLALIEFGAVKGISIGVGTSTVIVDSVVIMKVVKVPKGKLTLPVTLQGTASAAGITMVGESSQSGQKVTTLTAFLAK